MTMSAAASAKGCASSPDALAADDGEWEFVEHDEEAARHRLARMDPELAFYVRALPARCMRTMAHRRTGEKKQVLTSEGTRLVALMVDTPEARDLVRWLDETQALGAERRALLEEMEANARRLSKRRQLPGDVYRAIRNRCQKALRANHHGDRQPYIK